MLPEHPWKVALEALSASPPRFAFRGGVIPPSWRPNVTRNPRHSDTPCFLEQEAIAFIRQRLREVVAGTSRGIVTRGEVLQSDPTRWAYVMIVRPSRRAGRIPSLYVKWTLADAGAGAWVVQFISFHESRRSHDA